MVTVQRLRHESCVRCVFAANHVETQTQPPRPGRAPSEQFMTSHRAWSWHSWFSTSWQVLPAWPNACCHDTRRMDPLSGVESMVQRTYAAV